MGRCTPLSLLSTSFFFSLRVCPPCVCPAQSGKALEELEDVSELEREKEQLHAHAAAAPHRQSLLDRGKMFVFESVQRYGFAAILLAASIPNPLFDLAGLTCGHFGIPFATFFGATLLGKAVIKVAIQVVFLVSTVKYGAVLFESLRGLLASALPGWGRLHGLLDAVERNIHSGQHQMCSQEVEAAVATAAAAAGGAAAAVAPGAALPSPVLAALKDCRACCTNHFAPAAAVRCEQACEAATAASPAADASLLSALGRQAWGLFLLAMILYFLTSLVNSLVQQRLAKLVAEERAVATAASLAGSPVAAHTRSSCVDGPTSAGGEPVPPRVANGVVRRHDAATEPSRLAATPVAAASRGRSVGKASVGEASTPAATARKSSASSEGGSSSSSRGTSAASRALPASRGRGAVTGTARSQSRANRTVGRSQSRGRASEAARPRPAARSVSRARSSRQVSAAPSSRRQTRASAPSAR